jgi:hypothetical protein
MKWLSEFVNDPYSISIFCIIYIFLYYVVSIFSVRAVKSKTAWWRKNGPLDIFTSFVFKRNTAAKSRR